MLPQVNRRDTAQQAVGSSVGSSGRYHRQVAQGFSQLSARIGAAADRSAVKEGEAAGVAVDTDSPLSLTGRDTLRGRAYDAAATRTYLAQVDVTARETLDELEQSYGHDPAGFERGLADAKAGILSNLPEALRPDVGASFDRLARPYAKASVRRHTAAVLEGDKAALEAQLSSRGRDLQRMAYLSEFGPEGDADIASELTGLRALLAQHGPKSGFEFEGEKFDADEARSGALGPDDMGRYLRAAESDAATSRVEGAFSRLGSPAERSEFVQQFKGDFKASDFTPDEYESLLGKMNTALRADQTVAKARITEAKQSIRDLSAIIKDGFSPGEGQLASARVQSLATGDPDVITAYQELEASNNFMSAARLSTPRELSAFITSARSKGKATRPEAARVVAAERLLGKMETEIKSDAVGWAARVGLIETAPLNPASETFAQDMQRRRAEAQDIAQAYDLEAPQFLSEAERHQFGRIAAAGGDGMIALSDAIVGAAQGDSLDILAEISEDAPVLAFTAGAGRLTGDLSLAREAALGIELRQIDGFKSRLPKKGRMNEATREVLGTAFSALPATEAAALESAAAIYEARAQKAGIFADDGDTGDGADIALFKDVLGSVLGVRRDRRNKVYGGVARVNNREVIAPNWIEAKKFDDLMETFQDEDWAAGSAFGAPVDQSGSPLTAKDLRDAKLTSKGNGQYWVSLGDPLGSDPQYAGDPNSPDGRYILEIDRLESRFRQDRRARYVFGGIVKSHVQRRREARSR